MNLVDLAVEGLDPQLQWRLEGSQLIAQSAVPNQSYRVLPKGDKWSIEGSDKALLYLADLTVYPNLFAALVACELLHQGLLPTE